MRKMIFILLAFVLILMAGCGKKLPDTAILTEAPTETTVEATTEPTEPVPECVNAVVQVADAPAILVLLNRGDKVDVVGEHDEDHYVIRTEAGYGLVEKQFLRLEGEEAYETWTGYARNNAPIYEDYKLFGEPLAELKVNTELEILEELNYCYLVKTEDLTGCMEKTQVSKNRITGGGGGGGSSSGGADGGDISLSFQVVKLSAIEQRGDVAGTAEVLADAVPVVLGYFQRDDLAPVVAEEGFAPKWEGHYTLYMEGIYAYLPENLALLEGEEAYAQWEGFAARNALVYDNAKLQGEGVKVNVNTVVTVLWDAGDFWAVSINEEVGYMKTEHVRETKIAVGGGGGGGSSSGGEWTPPAL